MAAGPEPGSCVWAFVEGGERPAMAYALTAETFADLSGATPDADGAALVRGQALRLRAGWDGVAELSDAVCDETPGDAQTGIGPMPPVPL
jgi:hypothetical protein